MAARSRSKRAPIRTRIYALNKVRNDTRNDTYVRYVRTYVVCPGYVAPVVRARSVRANCGWAAGGDPCGARGICMYVSRGQPVDVRNHEDPTPRSSDLYNLFCMCT